MKNHYIIIILFVQILLAQSNTFDEKQFFIDLKNSYYNLNDTNIKNFSALVTSLKMERFSKENWNNAEIFPLQLIWFKPDNIYLAQQGTPTIPENKFDEYQELVDGIKQQVKGILVDFQRFYITGIFESINSNYSIKNDQEFVWISFDVGTEQNKIPVMYTMGRNGLCLKIEIEYMSENKKITIYPSFKIVKTKWLCDGWTVQTLINDEPVSGFILEINYSEYQSIWIPMQIIINVQKADEPETRYYDAIKFRNYMFDQPMELKEGLNLNH
jgi:hypothetical protein